MLLILATWIYILIVSYLYGHAFITLITKALKEKKPVAGLPLVVVSGFTLIAALSTYFSLFIKLGTLANCLLLVPALLYLLLSTRALQESWKAYTAYLRKTPAVIYFFVLVVVVMALLLSAAPHAKFDDGLYYRQSIKWIENYPAIAGLGNLHLKFSFNSSWHILSALFSFSFLGLQLNDLNGLLFIIISLYALDGLRAIMKKQFQFSDVFKVVTIAPLHLLYSYMLSPSPDLVVPYLIWLVFVLFLQKIERNKLEELDTHSFLILILSVFAVIIKLSAIPIALISIYLVILQLRKQQYTSLLSLGAVVALLVAPWMMRNVILSGYLVYPFYQLDLFDVDWKIPTELVKLEVLETKSFAKIRGMLFTEVDSLSVAEWLPYWFSQLQFSEKLISLLLIAISIVLPIAVANKLISEKLTQQKLATVILLVTIYTGIFFWFFTAPHFRYGMGFTVGLYLLGIAYFLYKFSRRYSSLTSFAFPVLLLLFFLKPLYSVVNNHTVASKQMLLKPLDVKYKAALEVEYHGISVYVPDSTAQCWDSPLPCAPFIVDGLQLRTVKIEEGFRVIEPNPGLYSQKRLESMKDNGGSYNTLHHN